MFNFFQKLGKSLLLPIAVLPICALVLGLGYLLAPASMGVGGDVHGVKYVIGVFLTSCGTALINNIAILFAVGVSVGLAKKNDGTAAIAAIVSWLIMITVLSPDSVLKIANPAQEVLLAFKNINNPFIGILAGLIGAFSYNKFRSFQTPAMLAFFSGKRFVAIVAGTITIAVTAILIFVWPVLFGGLMAFGNFVLHLEGVGVGLYMIANRLLIPVGMHHALNNVFWFDTVGIGDLTNFWAGKTTEDVSWSLGMYMSGFFPCMMFGVPGACVAFIAKSKNKRATIGVLGSMMLCALLCGVTEPFEFMFMFMCFPLYIIYSILYGIFGVITYYVGFRAGFSFSGGLIDLVFSSSLPAAQNTWMIIPLGIGAFIVFFLVFYFYVSKFKFVIPGGNIIKDSAKDIKEAATSLVGSGSEKNSDNEYMKMAKSLLSAIGGVDNVVETDHCVTRLRLTLADGSKVDDDAVKAAGANGCIKPTKNACQIVVGTKVQFVYDEFIKLTGED